MIKKEDVKKSAHLARVQISDSELQQYALELAKVVEFFDQIEAVDTKGVKPLYNPLNEEACYRKDERQNFDVDEILETAPESVGRLFKVPPVV